MRIKSAGSVGVALMAVMLLAAGCGGQVAEERETDEMQSRVEEPGEITTQKAESKVTESAVPDDSTERIETQIKGFARQREAWIEASDGGMQYFFTLAELDNDGLVELVVSGNGGTGHYTYSRFYKMGENGRLKELETSFEEGDSQPDLICSSMTVYSSFSKEGACDYYIVYDDLKNSAMDYVYRISSLCVRDGRVQETPLAIGTQTYDLFAEDESDCVEVYKDCNGNSLTREEFKQFPEDYYAHMGLTRKTASFQWEDMGRIQEVSDEEAEGILREVYENFSLVEAME